MKHACFLLFALLAAILCLSRTSAQTPASSPPLTGKVAHITIVGTKNIPVDTVRAVLALKPGDAYMPDAAAKGAAAIKSMGVFNAATTSETADPAGGVDVAYTVLENPVIQTIKFTTNAADGKPSVPFSELAAQMKTQPGQVLNTNVLVKDLNSLFNHTDGYAVKQGHLFDVSNAINIDPKTGLLTIPLVEYYIQSIQVTGNSRVKTKDILAQMHTEAGDLYDGKGLYSDESSIYEMGQFRQIKSFVGQAVGVGKINITIPVVEQPAATGTLDEKQGKIIPFLYDPLICPFPIIQVSVNGKPPLPFIVDTGSSPALLLDPWAAKELGLKVNTPVQKNIGGVAYQQAALQGVVLQGAKRSSDVAFNTQEAYVLDISLLSQLVLGQRVAGIVGLGMLAGSTSRFDFAAKTLTVFTAPHPPLSIADGIVLPLRSDAGGTLTARATLAADTYADLLVDTGSDSTQLPLSALEVLHPTAIAFNSIYARLDGIYACPALRLPVLLIGKLSVPNVAVGTLPPPTRPSLGMNILAGYRMTLDCPNAQLILEPSANGGRYTTGSSGSDVRQRDKVWQVVWLQDQSPAFLAGLQRGDVIMTVNGISVKDLAQTQMNHLLSGIAGRPLRVVVQRPAQGRESKNIEIVWLPLDDFSAIHHALYGVVMEKAPGGPWSITDVIKGCPGSLAGLATGDKITQMDGTDTAIMPMNDYIELMGNSSVLLEVEREGVAKPFAVRLSEPK